MDLCALITSKFLSLNDKTKTDIFDFLFLIVEILKSFEYIKEGKVIYI
jgi:hypothetical protein